MVSTNKALVIPPLYAEPSYHLGQILTENGTGLPALLNEDRKPTIPIRYVTPRKFPGRKQYEIQEQGITAYRTAKVANRRIGNFLAALSGVRVSDYHDFGGVVATAPFHTPDSEEFLAGFADGAKQSTGFEGDIGLLRVKKQYEPPDQELQAVFTRLFNGNLGSYPFEEIMAYTFDPDQARPMIETLMQLGQDRRGSPNSTDTNRRGVSLDDLLNGNGEEPVRAVDVTPFDDAIRTQYELPDDGISVHLGQKIVRKNVGAVHRNPSHIEGAAATLPVHHSDLEIFLQKFISYAKGVVGYDGDFGLLEAAKYYTSLSKEHRNAFRSMFGGELASDNAYEVLSYTFDEQQVRPMVDTMRTLTTLINTYHRIKSGCYQRKQGVVDTLKSTSFYRELKSKVQACKGEVSRERLTGLLRKNVIDPYKRRIANATIVQDIKQRIQETPEYQTLATAIKAAKNQEYRMQLWGNLLEEHMGQGLSYSTAAERMRQSKVYKFVNRLTRGSIKEGVADVLREIVDRYKPKTQLAPVTVTS